MLAEYQTGLHGQPGRSFINKSPVLKAALARTEQIVPIYAMSYRYLLMETHSINGMSGFVETGFRILTSTVKL
jgi:hypothetical protein